MTYCTNCGAPLQNEAAWCSNCGAKLQSEEYTAQSMPQGRELSNLPSQKKSKKGLAIGLTCAGVVLAAGITVLVLWLTGIIGGSSSKNPFVGEWKFHSVEIMGMTMTAETFSAMMGEASGAVDFNQMYCNVNESGMVELSFMGMTRSVQGQFVGDKLQMEDPSTGQTIMAVLEDGKLVLPTEEDGVSGKMVFAK